MSTDYVLVCDKHCEAIYAVRIGNPKNPETGLRDLIPAFLYAHLGCSCRLIWTEAVPRYFIQWEKENYEALVEKGGRRKDRENEGCRMCGSPTFRLDFNEKYSGQYCKEHEELRRDLKFSHELETE